MKILFITRNFPPAVCGVGDYTSKLTNEFARNKHEVYVLTSKDILLKQEKVVINAVITKWNLFAIPSIMRSCKRIDPDVISIQYVPYSFSNKGMPFWLIILYLFLKAKNYSIVTTFHEVGIRYTKNNIKRKITAASQFLIARIVAGLSKKNITSIDLYVSYLRKYSDEVYQIPIGANILPSDDVIHHFEEVTKKIAPNDEFIISSFGTRISDVILYTLAELKEKGNNVKLLLLGNLPESVKKDFIQLAENLGIHKDIYITGYLEENELYTYLKISSLFVMAEFVSAKGEGGISAKSGTLAAAFAAGIPIIGTKGDTTDNVFKNNKNIFLINEYTHHETAKRIIEIMQNKEQLQSVTKQAKITYDTYFSWKKIYEKYFEVISIN